VTEFKVGDRVRVIEATWAEETHGYAGTIAEIYTDNFIEGILHPYRIAFDSDSPVMADWGCAVDASKVELVDKPRFETLDSGVRVEYASGMQRDTDEGKPRYDLFLAKGIAYEDQYYYRIGIKLAQGATKYGDRNHEKADSEVELDRMKASAQRHLTAWIVGEQDEDHAAGVAINMFMAESLIARRNNGNSKTD
jgi:hypothetical protein